MTAPYQYIILHQSVKNHPGVLACQVMHAAGESIRKLPVSDETRGVALVAEKSEDLERLHEQLTAAGIHHVVIHEPDAPYFGAATAVGVEPLVDREVVRPFMSVFKVLR